MLTVFENSQFGSIRTLVEDGKPLFCGNDVARALGYSNPRDALRTWCKGVATRDILTEGGRQKVNFIPESDLYRLAFSSKLPGAVAFTDWVTEEVLPSIREKGSYVAVSAPAAPALPEPAAPALTVDDNSLSGVVQAAIRSTLVEVMPFVRQRRREHKNVKEQNGQAFIGMRIDQETLDRFDRACAASMMNRTDMMKDAMRRTIMEFEARNK